MSNANDDTRKRKKRRNREMEGKRMYDAEVMKQINKPCKVKTENESWKDAGTDEE